MASMVAENLRRSMEEKGLYQKYVARRAGFTEQQLTDMVKGRKVIRAEYLPALAEAIGIEINDFYKQ